jgi:hypothetical protein
MATLSGGANLARKLLEFAKLVNNPTTLRVGFLSNAKYPDGTPVAMIAAIQDFGAPGVGIPPRPFFRNMIAKHSKEWPAGILIQLRAHDWDAARALSVVGDAIAGQLRQSIIDTNAPPLKPATIARKGFDKPLVDTGHMLNSVDWEVDDAARLIFGP